jgi:hypothetical protein
MTKITQSEYIKFENCNFTNLAQAQDIASRAAFSKSGGAGIIGILSNEQLAELLAELKKEGLTNKKTNKIIEKTFRKLNITEEEIKNGDK